LLGYGYGPGYKGLLCTLLLSKNGIKLGISHGSELPDPKQLMQGSGKAHRHVQLRTKNDLKQPGLKLLLKAALAAWKKRNENNGYRPGGRPRQLSLSVGRLGRSAPDGGQVGVIGFVAGIGRLAVLLGREGMDEPGLEASLAEGVLHRPVVGAG